MSVLLILIFMLIPILPVILWYHKDAIMYIAGKCKSCLCREQKEADNTADGKNEIAAPNQQLYFIGSERIRFERLPDIKAGSQSSAPCSEKEISCLPEKFVVLNAATLSSSVTSCLQHITPGLQNVALGSPKDSPEVIGSLKDAPDDLTPPKNSPVVSSSLKDAVDTRGSPKNALDTSSSPKNAPVDLGSPKETFVALGTLVDAPDGNGSSKGSLVTLSSPGIPSGGVPPSSPYFWKA